jgi:hypothetical protein
MKGYVGADASSAPRSEAPSGSRMRCDLAPASAIALRAIPDDGVRGYTTDVEN